MLWDSPGGWGSTGKRELLSKLTPEGKWDLRCVGRKNSISMCQGPEAGENGASSMVCGAGGHREKRGRTL